MTVISAALLQIAMHSCSKWDWDFRVTITSSSAPFSFSSGGFLRTMEILLHIVHCETGGSVRLLTD